MIKSTFRLGAFIISVLMAVTCCSDDTSKPSAASESASVFEVSEKVTESVGISESPESVTETEAEEGSGEPSEDTEEGAVQSAGYISDHKSFMRMRISTIMQEEIGMYYGCEAVSLSMALKYYGYDIDPETLFVEHMKSGAAGEVNPFYAYVGDPRDNTGHGCYAPCAVRCVNSYLESVGSTLRAKDISGASMDEIRDILWEGKPVVIWGTLDMKPSRVLSVWSFGGNPVYWYRLSHCVVLSGLHHDRFFVCDPMVGSVNYLQSDVERSYNQIYTQALIIE